MKVALSVDALAPPLTGIGRYCWELCCGLERDTTIDQVDFVYSGMPVAHPAALLEEGARALPKGRLKRRFARAALRWRTRDSLWHGPNYFLPEGVTSGVVTMHDLSVLRFPETHPIERVKSFERHFARSLAAADHVLTDTEAIRAELCAFAGLSPDRVSSVPLGVDPAFRPLGADQAHLGGALEGLPFGQYGLCVSMLEPRKRIESLLDAWRELPAALRARHPLLLVGAIGWNVAGLMERVSRGRAEGWLHYAGYVDEGDLPRVFAGARLFVFPSRYEGFGLPPLEAMASGVPTIVANEKSLVEVTSGSALVTEPDDLGRFRDDITMALQDEAWRSAAITAGIEVASRYTWQRCVSGTVQAYRLATGL